MIEDEFIVFVAILMMGYIIGKIVEWIFSPPYYNKSKYQSGGDE